MFSIELITLAIVTIINVVIVWIIASQGWHTIVNRYFVGSSGGVIFWSLGTLLVGGGQTQEVIDIGRVMFTIAPIYVILFLSYFAALYPKERGKVLNLPNQLLTVFAIFLTIVSAIAPHNFITSVVMNPTFNQYTVDFFWYSLYTLYFNVAFIITFGGFIIHIRRTKGNERQRLSYIFTGTALVAFVALITNLLLPLFFNNTNFVWLGASSSLFYVVTVAISIVKHQLFDIKLAAVRSVAYIGVLLTLAGIYYALGYILSLVIIGAQTKQLVNFSPINVILVLVLALLFQPIKSFFDRVTNSIFYRDTYRSEDFFAALSELLTSTVDLRGLLERASHQIADTFKAEQVHFLLYYTNSIDHHMSAGTRGHARIPVHDAKVLDEYVRETSDKIILTELISDNAPIRRMLLSYRIAIVMPLRHGDEITGYVMLGDHRSGNYTRRDLNVLLAVSSELVIAIQNALSLHEVKELNATLQQRINVATKELRSSNAQLKHLDQVKDEFMSMASHQLRTPLTSIKGYLSMVLEGDAGTVNPQQERLLLEAFNSSERMVRLIADFLNVSRLQTGKFNIEKKHFDIRDVVRQEVKDLEMIAESHGQKLRLTIGNQPMPIYADEDKVRQVMMNFIDNAIYYSNAKSTIIINLERVKSEIAFTVIDTGIGVPLEEQEKLFTKFFRAENARQQRPDGTGVGLYLARRVIKAHGGSIIFSSKEGKGSTFGFRLPIDVATEKSVQPADQKAAVK